MTRSRAEDFVCPHCGADLPGGAKFCPECGSDENTGWSEDTYLDGVSLPGEDDGSEPGAPVGNLDRGHPLWMAVAALLLALAVGALLFLR